MCFLAARWCWILHIIPLTPHVTECMAYCIHSRQKRHPHPRTNGWSPPKFNPKDTKPFFPPCLSWWQCTRSRTLTMEVTAPAPAPPAPRAQNPLRLSWAQRRPSSLTRPTVRSRSPRLPSDQVSPEAVSCHHTLWQLHKIKLVVALINSIGLTGK